MGVLDIADALAKMVFTSARDWRRSVRMDRNTRDVIVKVLRSAAVASRAIPAAERVALAAPKTWDTVMKAGRLHYWDGVKWVKAWSNKYLVGP